MNELKNTCPWCGAKGRRVEGIKTGAACSDSECPLYSKWFFVEQWENRKTMAGEKFKKHWINEQQKADNENRL